MEIITFLGEIEGLIYEKKNGGQLDRKAHGRGGEPATNAHDKGDEWMGVSSEFFLKL